MNPAELLSKVTARAAPWEILPSAYGSLRPVDILHALGLVHHTGASLLIRVKYAGQTQFIRDLDRVFWFKIIDISNEERWPYPIKYRGKEFYRSMGRLALTENIDPGSCLHCGGVASQVTESGRVEICPECDGTGKKRHTDRKRARALGMPWSSFCQYVDKYHQILGVVDRWESIGLGAISKRLSQSAI